MKKRITAVILVAVLAVTTLTGCSSSMSGKDAAVTVNGIDVTADIAEFYARYIQAGYETYYAAYMGNDMQSGTHQFFLLPFLDYRSLF